MAANMAFTTFDPTKLAKLSVGQSDKRQNLFRKSQRDLLRECKKYNISAKGASNKAELVELLLTSPSYGKKPKKPKKHGRRAQSDALTLSASQYRKSRKGKTDSDVSDSDNYGSNTELSEGEDGLRFGNRYKLAGSSTPTTIKLAGDKNPSFNITKINSTTKRKKRGKKKNQRSAASDALTLRSADSVPTILPNRMNKKKQTRNSKKNGTQTSPTLSMYKPGLMQLNSLHLNEISESTETKDEEIFIEHMELSEIQLLNVNDCIDFRAENGFVFSANIINKVGPVLTVTYKNNMGDITEVKSNYNKEIYRFAKHESISLRESHRMKSLQIGNTVDINPKYIVNEWIVGEVINKDFKSGQVQIEYSYNNEKSLYWTHTDNIYEIAPYLTHYDMNAIMDSYLDSSQSDTNNNNYKSWTVDDIINWFNAIENGKFNDTENKEKYIKMKDGIRQFNIDYAALFMVNQLTLKLLGIDDENDRKLILNEIKKIIGMSNNDKLKQQEMEIVRLKQQLFLQKEEIAMLKEQQRTRIKPKAINTKSKSIKGLKASKSYRNGYNVSQTPTNNKSKKSLLKKSKTTTWRSSSHTFDSGTPKNNPKKKFGKLARNKSDADGLPARRPKLGNAVSAPVYTETEKKKTKKGKKKNKNNEDNLRRKIKKQKSLRYDENLQLKIKGLSALDLFVKEYEHKKGKKKKDNDDADFSTDDDFEEEWIDDIMD